ncbi:MAG: TetR/AcrR family transcriptional regulator [Gammaproteobacteria bacterium]|nr:TetR/AcrR family transcriptional regulator [Gammaproteobacteria bacterium]
MSPKIEHILNCAMTILKESGDQGLTMRKIAEAADMRLSNVQYYFKTKELLLGALLEGFLLDYLDSVQLLSFSDRHDQENKLRLLVSHILSDIESSDCAVVFKEIWAIAERNNAVKKAVDDYYKKLHAILFEALKKLAPENCQEQQVDNAVAILLPFIEGYCITSSNLKVSTEKLSEQLASILYKLLNKL